MPVSATACVYCIWHKDLLLFFAAFPYMSNQVWMNHPAWYMKPVHVLLRLTGIKHICLGSSGNSGKQALEKVIGFLKKGYSTTVACDGPAGPPYVLKPGVLLMSRDAHIPVIPLHFSCNRYTRLGAWDKKIVPGLFSTITICAGAPVQVEADNLESSATIVTQHLNGTK